jgi:catechol-2,3-dioxygenase
VLRTVGLRSKTFTINAASVRLSTSMFGARLTAIIGANMKRAPIELGQVAVTVSDVGKALPFYRDVLGLEHLFSPAPNLAFLAAGSVRIMLTTPQGAGSAGANSK